jgi:uncharacterized repeat protein (TIGR01451 family)
VKARLPILAMLVVALGLMLGLGSATAQVPPADATGAGATKDCPGLTAQLGQTVTCTFTVENEGATPATITELVEISPDPGGAPVDISCSIGAVTYDEGDLLPNDQVCSGSFTLTVPNDPALCGTALRDRVEVEFSYPAFTPPLTSGAFATHTTLIACPADISITKTADALGKIGDPVTYTFVITNDGDATATRVSVIDTLLGNISASFPATLAAGQSATVTINRTVVAGDTDPLPNTVTAIYSSGATQDSASASASTNLFQPSIAITKNCAPDNVAVGDVVLCTIVISNTSSADTPTLQASSITDTRSGNLLVGGNTNVVSTTCGTGAFVSGGSCTIVTTTTVTAAMLPGPLVNSVTVNASPTGFPNVITATAQDSVAITPPQAGEGCTPGYWKQDQHFDSWVGFSPNQTLESVFNVPDSLGLDNVTLAEALALNGGGVNALLRHAVAALLNSSSPGVDYDLSTAAVIAATNAALASGDYEAQKNIFAALNEQGCPLS